MHPPHFLFLQTDKSPGADEEAHKTAAEYLHNAGRCGREQHEETTTNRERATDGQDDQDAAGRAAFVPDYRISAGHPWIAECPVRGQVR